ncbi:WSC-domain-containing protein [Dacryopinax primogenitus]|uniref:WSC-domain-containing protein n=1 Tax=Dacryopinax primogenitus (strain DJM 731) TaxID=1858805 RepID=M5G104_DACPD|nr:WSC-domain-containing protein [Dacryopinax primogenitus]EJT99506.1 WSC-domain-containing protein [Dacryopinax primogenitus]
MRGLLILPLALGAYSLPPPSPTPPPLILITPFQASTPSWTSLGCRVDSPSRALTGASQIGGSISVESCETFCAQGGYVYAGVEYGDECYCGNELDNGAGGQAADSDCNMPCSGNSGETCGGSYRLNLYSRTGTPTSPTGWTNLGCRVDSPSRALTGTSQIGGSNSVESCETFCAQGGYVYAGVEYGDECYCGNELDNGAGGQTAESDCNMPCSGNNGETCGGSYRLNLYSRTGTPTSTTSPTATGWTNLGCRVDSSARALTGPMQDVNTNSVESCERFCLSQGYVYAGVEVSFNTSIGESG